MISGSTIGIHMRILIDKLNSKIESYHRLITDGFNNPELTTPLSIQTYIDNQEKLITLRDNAQLFIDLGVIK